MKLMHHKSFCLASAVAIGMAAHSLLHAEETSLQQVTIESKSTDSKMDEREAKAVALYQEKLPIASQTTEAASISKEIEKYTDLMGQAREQGRSAYNSGRLGAQMAATNRIQEYSGMIMRLVAKENTCLNKAIWGLLSNEEKGLFLQFLPFVPRDAGEVELLAKRPKATVPHDWTPYENTKFGYTAWLPRVPEMQAFSNDEKEIECRDPKSNCRLKISVHNLVDAEVPSWRRVSTAKEAAESVAFSEGVGPEYSGKCTFLGGEGHEVDFSYQDNFGNGHRVNVRAIKRGDCLIVFSCERDFTRLSMRIPSVFFDSLSMTN